MRMVKKNKNIAIFCGSKLGHNTIYKKEISIMTTMLSDNGFNICLLYTF